MSPSQEEGEQCCSSSASSAFWADDGTTDSKIMIFSIGLKCGAGGGWQQKDGVQQEGFVPALEKLGTAAVPSA